AVPPPDPSSAPTIDAIRRQLATARGLEALGRYAQAIAIAEPELARARGVGYAPVLGEALMLVGDLDHDLGRPAAATLEEGLQVSTEAGASATAVEAASSLVWVLANDDGRFDAAEAVANLAAATARRAKPPVEI